eukprot:4284581-Amphidinium_carterae.1
MVCELNESDQHAGEQNRKMGLATRLWPPMGPKTSVRLHCNKCPAPAKLCKYCHYELTADCSKHWHTRKASKHTFHAQQDSVVSAAQYLSQALRICDIVFVLNHALSLAKQLALPP